MNGLEKVNGNTVIHHSEGRILENSGTESPFEFVISDHLGNGRVWFRDLNWDGELNINSQDPGLEVTQVKHYYPFGFEMDIQTPQAAMPSNDQDRKTYNGIESFGSLKLQVAHYRVLDPGEQGNASHNVTCSRSETERSPRNAAMQYEEHQRSHHTFHRKVLVWYRKIDAGSRHDWELQAT